jgi:2-keto-3-deoxy-L-rhamnonate aldolase RhmA
MIAMTYVTLADPAVTELAALAGFDAVLIDLEHWPSTLETLTGHLRAAESGGMGTMVRVPDMEGHYISRVLDLGADGVMAPHIVGADSARTLVTESRYPPLGHRGFADNVRAAEFGQHGHNSYRELADAQNASVVVAALVEDKAGVEDCEEIARTEGLDMVMIGPGDLSASMGLLGSRNDPAVRKAVEQVCQVCTDAKMPFCLPVGSAVVSLTAEEAHSLGARILIAGGDISSLMVGLQRTREAMIGVVPIDHRPDETAKGIS